MHSAVSAITDGIDYYTSTKLKLDLHSSSLFSIGCFVIFYAATTKQQMENKQQVQRSNFN